VTVTTIKSTNYIGGLSQQRAGRIADGAIKAEKNFLLPLAVDLSAITLFQGLQSGWPNQQTHHSSPKGVASQNLASQSQQTKNSIPLSFQGLAPIVGSTALDAMSVLSYAPVNPAGALGNLLRLLIDGGVLTSAITQNDTFANFVYPFSQLASALIATAWGSNSNPAYFAKVNAESTFAGKLKAEFGNFKSYWTKDMPNSFQNLFGDNKETALKGEKLFGLISTNGAMLHAGMAILGTVFLILSKLFSSDRVQNNTTEMNTTIHETKADHQNSWTDKAWQFLQLSKIPIMLGVFASAFNPHEIKTYAGNSQLAKYGFIGSTLIYFASMIANLLEIKNVFWGMFTDATRNIAANTRSLFMRQGRLDN
jgi:hypothetical protein